MYLGCFHSTHLSTLTEVQFHLVSVNRVQRTQAWWLPKAWSGTSDCASDMEQKLLT